MMTSKKPQNNSDSPDGRGKFAFLLLKIWSGPSKLSVVFPSLVLGIQPFLRILVTSGNSKVAVV